MTPSHGIRPFFLKICDDSETSKIPDRIPGETNEDFCNRHDVWLKDHSETWHFVYMLMHGRYNLGDRLDFVNDWMVA